MGKCLSVHFLIFCRNKKMIPKGMLQVMVALKQTTKKQKKRIC